MSVSQTHWHNKWWLHVYIHHNDSIAIVVWIQIGFFSKQKYGTSKCVIQYIHHVHKFILKLKSYLLAVLAFHLNAIFEILLSELQCQIFLFSYWKSWFLKPILSNQNKSYMHRIRFWLNLQFFTVYKTENKHLLWHLTESISDSRKKQTKNINWWKLMESNRVRYQPVILNGILPAKLSWVNEKFWTINWLYNFSIDLVTSVINKQREEKWTPGAVSKGRSQCCPHFANILCGKKVKIR